MDKIFWSGKPRIRIRPTPQGIAALVFPPLLAFTGTVRHAVPVFVLGVGFPALVLLSLLFLILSLPALIRSSRTLDDTATAISDFGRIGESLKTRTASRVPAFLPGVRLQVAWSLRFGPFRRLFLAPLTEGVSDGLKGRRSWGGRKEIRAGRGAKRRIRGDVRVGTAVFRFNRRGLWEGRVHLRAVDPFGCFIMEFPLAGFPRIAVPPYNGELPNRLPTGRLSADEKSAPRMREDAEERLERRSYIPGDDPRRIDWKQYARTGDLLVRVGEDALPVRGRVWIFVAGSFRGFPSRRGYNRLDECLEAASALVRGFLENDRDVRLHLSGGTSWLDTSLCDWEAAMAASKPVGINRTQGLSGIFAPSTYLDVNDMPPQGETLLIVVHPSDPAGFILAEAAQLTGCRVSFVYPGFSSVGKAARKLPGIRTEGKSAGLFRREKHRLENRIPPDGQLYQRLQKALHRRCIDAAEAKARSRGFNVYVL